MGRSLNVLNIYAGKTSSGNTKAEEVLLEDIDVNTYKLLSALGLALNLAKGDIFKFFNSEEPVKVIH